MRRNRRLTPEGTRDLLFEESLARREAEGMLSDLFVSRGFSEVMTPGMEFYDVFHADTMAIPAESMYKFTDDKGRLLVMRPDSTMPIARLVATRLQHALLPIRLYYAQDVFRFHHGLSGHYNQIFQAGVELIGAAGERADLEVLSLAAEALRLGAGDAFRLEIGHVGFFRSLMGTLGAQASAEANAEALEEVRTLIENKNYAGLSDALDALPPSPAVDALRRLPRLFGGEEVFAEAAALFPDEETRGALAHLAKLYSALRELGLDKQVLIDLGLVQENEYYTGVIFRGYIEGSGDTVVSGGRYDTLLQQFGSPLPATGFGVNVDCLTKTMLDKGEVDPPMPPEILVHAMPGYEIKALQRVAACIDEGMLCEFSVFDDRQASLDYAQARNIGRVVVVGEQEETLDL